MASQDARLSKFEADFKQQQSEMINKIDTVLKAITNRITRALPSETVKNPKLNVNSTSPALSACSYPTEDPHCSTCTKDEDHHTMVEVERERKKSEEEEREEKDEPKNIKINPSSPPDPLMSFNTEKEDDGDVMFIKIIKKDDDSREEDLEGIMRRKLDPREDPNKEVSNFTGRIKGMHIFVGNFTYVSDFMIFEDISSIIQVVLGKPFVEVSNMTHDLSLGVVKFTNRTNEIAYKMPHKIEQYNSLLVLEKEHMKSVYLRNEEDKRRGVDYVMNKILGFYKECLEIGPEYLTGLEDEGGVT
ncbi:hypothetical protein Tco_0340546 [Tanacetum coccineum]